MFSKLPAVWLAAITLISLAATPSQASIVVTASDMGNGTISGAGPSSGNSISLSKDFTSFGPMGISVEVQGSTSYTIQEDIANNTGVDWTDFHWDMESNGVTLTEISNISPFGSSALTPLPVTVSGGVLASGSTFSPTLTFTASSADTLRFFLFQNPSRDNAIPEPATIVLFGLGLIGVGAAARRRRVSVA